ncbi:hypothetical protein VTN77DRAFT_6857 [Rasamsonia byssochlamydoides]|uniref:uncharacterized protein n=1 Tax=Rasamsonia byssochlamydoides TaxID=89139 RepID=UPI003743115B
MAGRIRASRNAAMCHLSRISPRNGEETVEWNFLPERWERVTEIVRLMHKARVHYGSYSPFASLVPGNPERVFCYDFLRSVTYQDEGSLSEAERQELDYELEDVMAYRGYLKKEYERGNPHPGYFRNLSLD